MPSAEDWMQRRLKHSMPGLSGRKETLFEVEENPQAMIGSRWVDAVDGYYLSLALSDLEGVGSLNLLFHIVWLLY